MRKKHLVYIAAFVALAVACLILFRGMSQDKRPVVAVVTFVSYPILDRSIEGITQSLRDHGYNNSTIRLVVTNANGQQALLPSIVTELLSSRPAVIVPVSTPVAQAVLKFASPKQDIVFSTVTNPRDLWQGLQPPNVTGVSDAVNYEANLDLIKEVVPKVKIIGIVYNPGEANSRYGLEQMISLTRNAGVSLKVLPVASSNEVPEAARSLAAVVDVIYVGSDNTVVSALPSLLSAAASRHIPVIASDSGSVDSGAVAAVSVDYLAVGRRVGDIVADLLRSGKMPGSIPNVIFLGESLIVNRRAARSMNVALPDSVVKRATRIVE
jgi:putative ABC transport system substrate-binding protein